MMPHHPVKIGKNSYKRTAKSCSMRPEHVYVTPTVDSLSTSNGKHTEAEESPKTALMAQTIRKHWRSFQAEDTHQGNYNLSGELGFFFPFLPDFHGNPFSLVGEQTRTRGSDPTRKLSKQGWVPASITILDTPFKVHFHQCFESDSLAQTSRFREFPAQWWDVFQTSYCTPACT